jgi:5-methylcytosine-specific restriction protein A
MRNPDWTRDELILALDLYFRAGRKQLDASHADVLELSSLLNTLGVHDGQAQGDGFRNQNGVAMKLGNFSAIDPARDGVGLPRGNKLERVVWDEYAAQPERLRTVAMAIRDSIEATEPIRSWDAEGEEEEFPEGRLLTRLHVARERNPTLVRKKKQDVLKRNGKLSCDCCEFDFAEVYGELGVGFAECHHRVPLSKLKGSGKTKLVDLAIVCANCHRMLHRTGSTIGVEDLRAILEARGRIAAK